jgi:hypothetical protein
LLLGLLKQIKHNTNTPTPPDTHAPPSAILKPKNRKTEASSGFAVLLFHAETKRPQKQAAPWRHRH